MLKYIKTLMVVSLWLGSLNSLGQADISGQKLWQQTTVADFQAGHTDSVVITKLGDGEV